MTKQTFVIVGTSLAGATAAAQLRKDGFDGLPLDDLEALLLAADRTVR
jgi:monoamine oxidase